MSVTNPMTTAREALTALLRTEFGPDGFEVSNDRLHRSLGRDGKTRIGTSPTREQPNNRGAEVMNYRIAVQFYGKWKDQIDPKEKVDPSAIETYAERFKRALRLGDPDTDNAWFFSLEDVSYPDDPTGNATRFEAVVTAFGRNSALFETVG
jgi:hypothetical protein